MCKAVTSLICHYCGMYSNSIYSNKEALFWKDLNRLHLLKDNHYLCLVPPFNTKSKISLQKMQKRQSRDYCTSRRLWQRILSFYRNQHQNQQSFKFFQFHKVTLNYTEFLLKAQLTCCGSWDANGYLKRIIVYEKKINAFFSSCSGGYQSVPRHTEVFCLENSFENCPLQYEIQIRKLFVH